MFINGILISIVPLARFANHAQPGHIVFHAEHDSLVAVGGDEVLEDAAQLGERLNYILIKYEIYLSIDFNLVLV